MSIPRLSMDDQKMTARRIHEIIDQAQTMGESAKLKLFDWKRVDYDSDLDAQLTDILIKVPIFEEPEISQWFAYLYYTINIINYSRRKSNLINDLNKYITLHQITQLSLDLPNPLARNQFIILSLLFAEPFFDDSSSDRNLLRNGKLILSCNGNGQFVIFDWFSYDFYINYSYFIDNHSLALDLKLQQNHQENC